MSQYGTRYVDGKKFYVYNTFHMNGKTHAEFFESRQIEPAHGPKTPVRIKYDSIIGATIFAVEIKKKD